MLSKEKKGKETDQCQCHQIDQINKPPEDGLKSSPETSWYIENKWISRKNSNKLYFLHLIDIINDLLLISSSNPNNFYILTYNTITDKYTLVKDLRVKVFNRASSQSTFLSQT